MKKPTPIHDISFNPLDWEGMIKLMENHKEHAELLIGTNDNGETITLYITHDNILLVTYQNNHWIRHNYYWMDGTTEEIYDCKWE